MGNLYEDDVIAWAEQQAALLRAGRWALLDIDNIAEEIEDVRRILSGVIEDEHCI